MVASLRCGKRSSRDRTTGIWCRLNPRELSLGCKEGLFERIDWTQVGARANYLPQATSDCGVGSIIYSFVLAFDADRLTGTQPKSWMDFFDLNRFRGQA